MGRIVNFLKVIRNNWKKSLFGAGVLAYGVDYAVDSYQISTMMRAYCEQAVKYGDEPCEIGKMRRITVILNPAANKKKAKKMFEQYCAPILHLAGVFVSVLETEKEGHARELIDEIEPTTDAIVVAGGDGTLSETITGLMRSRGELCKIPIGVLPLGQRNLVARALFEEADQHNVATVASATLAVIKGNVKPVDAFRIEVINTDPDASSSRPVYGVGSIEWGLRRELRKKADGFWWVGALKDYAPLIFHGHRYHIGQDHGFIRADIRYSPPCQGCSSCYQYRADLKPQTVARQTSRWWNVLSLQNRRNTRQDVEPATDYSTIINERCSTIEEKHVVTSDLQLVSNNLQPVQENIPKLAIKVGPTVKYQGDLVSAGLKILKDDPSVLTDIIEAKQVEIRPLKKAQATNETLEDQDEDSLSIDNEDFEVRPIRVSVLPNSIKVFCK
ncbi:Diacylglycerol kinase catalytic domain [Nesidiocoris tenuis]|uniref:Acylglycerol kinase, mitochondrial n=1 Tax=Nesidiocoris tenuis TaxID=355587 RepID=A0ABN7A9E8_9HEMI|nr:Diacylglycerol kinase catalytic domain [Nesidiocoris tenuis]